MPPIRKPTSNASSTPPAARRERPGDLFMATRTSVHTASIRAMTVTAVA